MTTIYDIAQLSNTSAATVSYVLSGRGDEKRISKATQERVQAVAERLNYRPNASARQLKVTGSPKTKIAAFWPEFSFEQALVSATRAIKNISALAPGNMEVSFFFFPPDRLSEVWDKTSYIGFNGILMAGASMDDLEFISGQPQVVPMVLINRTLEGFSSVTIDHEAAGLLACELAHKRGGDSVCSVWANDFHVATNLRQQAFAKRCAELGIEFENSRYFCETTQDAGYELCRSLVQNGLLKKVIYCNDESIAQGVLIALNESGVEVGRDVFLLTANNGPDAFCRYMTPSVTTVDLRFREVFEQGLKLLLDIIAHHTNEPNSIVLQPRCVYRGSLPEVLPGGSD